MILPLAPGGRVEALIAGPNPPLPSASVPWAIGKARLPIVELIQVFVFDLESQVVGR